MEGDEISRHTFDRTCRLGQEMASRQSCPSLFNRE
jgi:hypothetical protein